MTTRCIIPGYPPGCKGGFDWKIERKRVKYEKRGVYCIVYDPIRAVLPQDACTILDAVVSGRLPGHWLFVGPPGTGKSTLLDIVEEVATFRVYRINPEEILSPYIGETEQKILSTLREAEANAPSIVIIDEADFMISRRGGEAGGTRDGMRQLSANIVRIMLRFLQRARTVSVLASTNKPMSEIDPAMVRHGRFKVLYFPPPDVEAARILFELYGRQPPGDEELRRIIVRALSFSNLVEYIATGRLRRYELNPYVRMLEPYPGCKMSVPRLLVVAEPPPTNLAYAALVGGVLDKPVLLLLDPEYFEDIVWLSRTTKMPVALPYTPRFADASVRIVYRLPRVILLGPEWLDFYRGAKSIDANTMKTKCMDVMQRLDCLEFEECADKIVEKMLDGDE